MEVAAGHHISRCCLDLPSYRQLRVTERHGLGPSLSQKHMSCSLNKIYVCRPPQERWSPCVRCNCVEYSRLIRICKRPQTMPGSFVHPGMLTAHEILWHRLKIKLRPPTQTGIAWLTRPVTSYCCNNTTISCKPAMICHPSRSTVCGNSSLRCYGCKQRSFIGSGPLRDVMDF
jgi:hypothetical protein